MDEHVAVRQVADQGRSADRLTSIADVTVRSTGGPHTASARTSGAALVACVTDLEARTCAITARDEASVCFTACDTPAEQVAPDAATAFAWAASFVHCLLVGGHTLGELRSARLVIRGSGDGGVELIPHGRLTDLE
ncbi:hypothetical protein [Actinomadura rugatobispora]|uniref:Uncharacterized protein n=1 Tax=Actinomadura rugatobispora TaxID=1994 RepID=A0ABW1AIX4_9ACTN